MHPKASSDSKWSKVHTKSHAICLLVQLRIERETQINPVPTNCVWQIIHPSSPRSQKEVSIYNYLHRKHRRSICKLYQVSNILLTAEWMVWPSSSLWLARRKGMRWGGLWFIQLLGGVIPGPSGCCLFVRLGIINESHQTTHEILRGSSGLGSSSHWLSSSHQPCLTSRSDIITIIHHTGKKNDFFP